MGRRRELLFGQRCLEILMKKRSEEKRGRSDEKDLWSRRRGRTGDRGLPRNSQREAETNL